MNIYFKILLKPTNVPFPNYNAFRLASNICIHFHCNHVQFNTNYGSPISQQIVADSKLVKYKTA